MVKSPGCPIMPTVKVFITVSKSSWRYETAVHRQYPAADREGARLADHAELRSLRRRRRRGNPVDRAAGQHAGTARHQRRVGTLRRAAEFRTAPPAVPGFALVGAESQRPNRADHLHGTVM